MNHLSLLRLVTLSLSFFSATSIFAAELPNIVWLTSEDHGPHMGCYGDALARTPNIDALAKKGMVFNHAWSCAPVCAPARTTIISGMYPSSTGAIHMRSMVPMPTGAKMYPEYLRERGYYCTNNSKEDYNLVKPEGLWNESSGKAHWHNRSPGQPFFAVFNSTKSHESQIRTRPHDLITDPAKVRVPRYHPDTPEVRLDWAQYYDKVSAADAEAGKVIEQLEKEGLLDETIVFYYADHGSGMPRNKRWPSNSGLHVPMVVYFPAKWQHLAPAEYKPGGRSDRLVNFVDLAPTLLSLVGIEPPKTMQGQPFAGSRQTKPQPFMFGQRGRMDERYDLVRSVTDGRYVYLRNFYPNLSQAQHVAYQFETPTTRVWREKFDRKQTTPEQSIFWSVPKAVEEFYDLDSDPDEVVNLADSPAHAEQLAKFRRACFEQMTTVRDVALLPEGEMHRRSQGASPYDLARDDARYPFAKIFEAASLASDYRKPAGEQLSKMMSDSDSAVRYWGVMGQLMRGSKAVQAAQPELQKALLDSSPFVRIAAAEALATYGQENDLSTSLEALAELAPTDKNGVFVSMAALSACEALGPKARAVYSTIAEMNPKGASPDARYNEYVPRLLRNLADSFEEPKPEKKAKGKKK